MTRYERRVLAVDDDGSVTVEGRIIAVLDSPKAGRNTITALVEVDETETAPTTFNLDDTEGIDREAVYPPDDPALDRHDDAPKDENGDPDLDAVTCAGTKSDGSPCTREVDEPGEKCWQHEED